MTQHHRPADTETARTAALGGEGTARSQPGPATASSPRSPRPSDPAHSLRLSDAEREAVAVRIRDAAAEGRLTLEEADERQRAIYEARFAADLEPLTADLPAPPAPPAPAVPNRGPLSPEARRRLLIHAGIGAAFAVLFLVRWVLGPIPFFWPAGPLFWIAVSIGAHYWWATRRRAVSPT